MDFKSLSRPDRTGLILEAAQLYWIDKRYSCHVEMGLNKRGRLRADLLVLNTKCQIVMTEVKSCWQDFKTDLKWHKYLKHCHKLYFAIDADLFKTKGTEIKAALKEHGCGLIVFDGHKCKVRQAAKERTMANSDIASLLIRMSWRGGRFKE